MGKRATPSGRNEESEQAGQGDGGGEVVGEPVLAGARGRKGKRLGMGKEDWSWDREGARKEVGQRPSWEQEDEGSKRKEGQASVPNAVQLLLVSDASSQVRQFCISTQLLQRHAAERMVVGRCKNSSR